MMALRWSDGCVSISINFSLEVRKNSLYMMIPLCQRLWLCQKNTTHQEMTMKTMMRTEPKCGMKMLWLMIDSPSLKNAASDSEDCEEPIL
ncbi:unnamed protein product [Heligmosomoides polygyrus]|uniref:Secreted protein n=1 Tax=Heligmosomoides polygyrus TaxID=6339 RepID=A0A183GWE3_HELPZ|nr:unnamed protein product [Heligmosomoides polygyrus]